MARLLASKEKLALKQMIWQYDFVLSTRKIIKLKIEFPFWLLSLLCLWILVIAVFGQPPGQSKESPKNNVLLITIDTLRADRLSCYNNSRPLSPNIDRLAHRGVLFHRAFAQTPTTLPSHANILLGTTPPFHGVHDNLNFIVAEDFLSLAEYLKQFGYQTAAFVGSYLLDHRFGLNQGFQVYDDNYSRPHQQKLANLERRAEEVIEPALNWLKKQSSPWFLWIHCYDPHDPYEPPEPFKSKYADAPYDGEVAYVDSALKPLIDLLETDPYLKSTIIIFTADHGEALGEHGEATHGFLAYNATLWVPLIIIAPGIRPNITDELVGHIDLFPTVCDLLNLPSPDHLQGVSLLSALKGKKLPSRWLYFESLYPYYSRGWAPIRGFYQNNLKFIDSPLPELYDIKKDFAEKNNLLKSGAVEKYKNQLASLLASLSGSSEKMAQKRIDRERLEKLRSLGYLSSQPEERRETFGPEHDVKTLLPYNNQAVKAMLMYQQGEKERAIESLQEIIKKCPQLDNAYSNLAIIYQKEKKVDKALEILRLSLVNLPSSYEFFANYLNLLVDAGKFDEALKFFEEKSPNFSRAITDPEILNLIGLAYSHKGELKKAIEIYKTALSADERYAPLLANLGAAYYSLFLQTKDHQALQNSMDKFKKAIEVDPAFFHPYTGLGTIFRLLGNLDGAIFCWEKAVGLNPDWAPAYYHLGLAQMEKGDFRKALTSLKAYQEKSGPRLSAVEKERLVSLIKACQEKLKNN